MSEKQAGTKEEKKLYEYTEYPKNIRQIGVPLPGTRVFLEDYVITYLKQSFMNITQSRIAILLGKPGYDQAKEGLFTYGAITLKKDDLLECGEIPEETWEFIYETIHHDFPGAQVLGWACGLGLWNSELDSRIKKLQKKAFKQENQIVFLWDLSEKEEKIFLWQNQMLRELSGYYIYYEKNPQMQNFMLDKPEETKSIDADYEDTVTASMRQVFDEKEVGRRRIQILSYCGAVAAGIAVLFGVHMMMDSTERIKEMEKTVAVLSEYVGKQQEEVTAMAQQTQDSVNEIAFENTQKEEKTALSEQNKKKQDEESNEVDKSEASQSGKDAEDSQSEDSDESAGSSLSGKDVEESRSSDSTGSSQSGESEKNAGDALEQAEEVAVSGVKKQAQSYIVQKGDTLSQIVWRQYHDISYEKKIKEFNNITNEDEIYVGQCILLPQYK